MKCVSTVPSPLIESLESRQLFSSTAALAIHVDKAYKGSADVNGSTYTASLVVTSYSTKNEHVDVTVEVINSKGKIETAKAVGKLKGRRVNWVLGSTGIELKADFSTNGKGISGVVLDGKYTGTFSLKLI